MGKATFLGDPNFPIFWQKAGVSTGLSSDSGGYSQSTDSIILTEPELCVCTQFSFLLVVVDDTEMTMLVDSQGLACERGVNPGKRRHGK